MLLDIQSTSNQNRYVHMLKTAGALSKLFSESKSPFLVSRNVENAFCDALDAINLGRADCSADASLNGIGVGIKTFLHGNGKTLQKIAEFNRESELYRNKTPKELIHKIAELRNERIKFTERTYQIHKMIYHCVTRKEGKILVFESPMDKVDVAEIRNIKVSNNDNTITFEDGLNDYSFNVTKSTLYKRFITSDQDAILEIDVEILDNPYLDLSKLFNYELIPVEHSVPVALDPRVNFDYVILPLFSDRGNIRHVPEKSGLNQWNAAGRKRNPNEVYIPIPKWIHDLKPNFFPNRDISFKLELPDSNNLEAKVCQENSKALMSNPNKDLGEWLLRQVLDLQEGELLTYEMLEVLGIDSVIVYKHSVKYYSVDFQEVGSYDQFLLENQNTNT